VNWWESLDPDVQKYAAGGVVTGTIALIGTIVTFVLSGIRDGRRETARREADRSAEDDRRKADREAEDERRKAERDDRREARDHERTEELRRRGLEGVQKALDAALRLRDALTDVPLGVERWSTDAKRLLREIQASALLVDRSDVRHGLYDGVDAVTTVKWRASYDEQGLNVPAAERFLVGHIRDLAGAYLRGHDDSVKRHADALHEAKEIGQVAVKELFQDD
jgi:hypothetical protein